MNASHEKKINELFVRYDADKSGTLDQSELQILFKELGVKKTKEEINSIVKKYATSDVSNGITLQQFKDLFSLTRLSDIFNKIDTDHSGFIDNNELSQAMKKLGYRITPEKCDAMMKAVDLNNDGQISFEEFRLFFETFPAASLESIAARWNDVTSISDCGTDFSPTIPPSGLHLWQTIVAGGCGGVVSRTATAPLEKIKIAAQTGMKLTGNGGIMTELNAIYRTQGIRGLFAGNFLNCLRVFPTTGITCTIYLNLLALTPSHHEINAMESIYHLSCGATAALIANTLTYPMDLIRARITTARTIESNSALIIMKDILFHGDGGIRGLYRGLKPTLLAVVPFVAIQNTSIDLLRDGAVQSGYEATPFILCSVGACAGIFAQLFVYPLDTLRRRIQMIPNNIINGNDLNVRVVSDSTWLMMRQVVQKEGIRSLFAGIIPTFIKTIPTVALFATVTGSFNKYFKNMNHTKEE